MTFFSRIASTILTPVRFLSTWFSRTIPGFRRLAQISLAARIAWMFFVFLLIVLGAGILRYWLAPADRLEDRNWLVWVLTPLVLMVVIPVCVYFLIKLLQQKPAGPTPLDQAWQDGLAALERQKIPLRKTPLFLILGCEAAAHARQLMDAAELGTTVKPPDDHNAPLLWYANSNAIFLFVNGCSSLSALAATRHTKTSSLADRPATADVVGTLDAAGFESVMNPGAAASPSDTVSGLNQPTPTPAPVSHTPARPSPSANPMGTISADTMQSHPQPGPAFPSHEPPKPVRDLPTDELNRRAREMHYLCDLLRKARRPICPINGVLALTPFELIEAASSESQKAILNDLQVLRQRLHVRCPATLLVSEMESVDGFLELVKRVGEEFARDRRFGKGCQVWGDPREDRLDAVAAGAVGAFEDMIYQVFRQPEALRRRYNNRLVSLLCRTRGPFAEGFRTYVRKGFGYDPNNVPELSRSQFLFHGCYFAATGPDEDRQAFLRGVLFKIIDNAGELEWAPQARAEDRVLQSWAGIAGLIGTVALVALLVGIVLLLRG